MNPEHAALVALLRSKPKKLTWSKLTSQVLESRSAISVWGHYNPDELIPSTEAAEALAVAEADLEGWDSDGLKFVSILDDEYPRQLLDLVEAPPFLFARGQTRAGDLGVAVVGSRKSSSRGIQIATGIASYLAREGLSVVSGLAEGIDAAAHTAALSEGGRTVACIATGINIGYPASNQGLQNSIADRGLLLSQFWPDAPPQKPNFLKRNALISGYSMAAIVVEAGENSGARNLARHAAEQGRPLILTDLVAQCNDWAKSMVGNPGVHVASSLEEIKKILDDIRAQTDLPNACRQCETE